jgi:ATP-binding cassette, subfamily B, bacterial
MGFFAGLGDEAYDRKYSDRELLHRIATYFKPHLGRLGWVAFLLITLASSAAAVPIIVARGVDLLAVETDNQVFVWLVFAIFLAGFYTWAANWIRRRILARVVGDVILTLRTNAFKATSEHDMSFYDEFSSGRIVSRITSDTRDFGQLVVIVTDLISQIVQALILGVVLIGIEWKLSLYVLGFLPILFWAAGGFRNMARKATKAGMKAMADVNATIKETVSGISVAKNFRQESTIFGEFDVANQTSYKVNIRRGFILALVFPTLNALGGISTGILVYVGGLSAVAGVVTVGAWYLFLLSLDRFFFPVLNLSAFWAQVQSGLSASERVFALIDAESAVVQTDSQPIQGLQGDIQFKRVEFRYSEQEQVFSDFNLQIKPGESVALVGHTGSGKSSIAKLVARFYEFQEGQILIDGHDIRSLDLPHYRGQLGIVSQTPFLFSGTVSENICYACAEASEDEVAEIAREIGGGEWLDTLPQGVQTQVGERGGRLSMGQRQLVSLLRVLVQRPAIFILDEATASIDPFTEWQIQQTLNLIMKNSTSILIAHRLSTIKAADRIIVLEDGRIIEEGNHAALLARDGHYANLYNTYFRHQSLAYVEQSRTLVGGD